MTGDDRDAPARRLLFGDDGSPGADVAWLWLVQHEWGGWSVDVVTAQEPPVGPPPAPEARELHEWAPPTPRHAPAEVRLRGLRHLTAQQDPRLALLAPADLTVIGARGTGVLESLHLGSTAEWLLHDPVSPLVVARHGRRTRHVLAGADGSRHAASALGALAALPWVADVVVRVLVVEDGHADPVEAAASALRVLEPTGAAVELVERAGRPTAAVLAEIDASSPDLVVLGTRGLSGWQRLRLGSTTNAVVRGTPCSLLVANADPA